MIFSPLDLKKVVFRSLLKRSRNPGLTSAAGGDLRPELAHITRKAASGLLGELYTSIGILRETDGAPLSNVSGEDPALIL